MSHTPGPWKLSPEEYPDRGGYEAPQIFSHADDTSPQFIAEMAVRSNWEENGNLIAAAPEMLEALMYVVQVRKIECSTHPDGFDEICAYCKIRVAIAKATGGAK